MNHAQHNPKQTVEFAYEAAQFTAHELAERLLEALDRLPTLDDEDRPVHSGHVACLGRVIPLLNQALEQLAHAASGRPVRTKP